MAKPWVYSPLLFGEVETVELFGREVITTNKDEITAENLLEVLSAARAVHDGNVSKIGYLYDYYKGKQEVLKRTKEVRPDICNKIVENRANEIVSFKVGYLCGEPIQYVSRNGDKAVCDSIARLNGYMQSEGKENADRELIEWDMICGTAYRLILPDSEFDEETDEAPFEIFTLDPREAFVIYSNKINHAPLAGVYTTVWNNERTYSVYTRTEYFEVKDNELIKAVPNPLGMIPIIEYPANTARLGAFEIVLPLLDAINLTESNRMDGIEQFIQSLAVAVNCQFDDDVTANDIREAGMIVLNSLNERPASFTILSQQLDQTQTQTLIDNMYEAVLTITGMPNRNGGSSTSDTGSAVVYRDGWSAAETRAKDSESIFKKSENTALKLVLKICKDLVPRLDLKISDISIKFTRRNFENTSTKATVLTTMLGSDKIAPRLAFQHCGMFSDSESAYQESVEYAAEEKRKSEALTKKQTVQGNGVGVTDGDSGNAGNSETV